MSVTGISAMSPAMWSADSESGSKKNSGSALSAKTSLAGTLLQPKQGIEIDQSGPRTNGVQAAASINPQATLRSDENGLQKALNSGELAESQHAEMRIVQDNHDIAASQAKDSGKQTSALPNKDEDSQSADPPGESEKGNLVDVMA